MAVAVPGAAPTPPHETFSSLKRSVVDIVQGADDVELLALAGRALNNAVRKLNTHNWNWSLRQQTITFVVDDADYNLNPDWKAPRKFQLNNSSAVRRSWLDWEPPKLFLDRRYDATQSGQPESYTVINPSNALLVLLNIPPSSSWVTDFPTGTLQYYSRVNTYSQDDDVLDIGPSELDLFVLWYARWEMLIVRGEERALALAFREWNDLLQRLRGDDREKATDWEI